MKTVAEFVVEEIAAQAERQPEEVTRDKRIGADLDFDSIDCVELVMELEDEFQIAITDADAEAWRTVGDVIDYIDGRPEAHGE